ncbi:MAG: cell division protein FtsH, partial [Alphaproteobacteria bacterium]|nr:cell division protein FtsH [Alphaproteobacteria bacterium]
VTQTQNVSEATSELIDAEVRRFIEEAEGKARTILNEHVDELHAVAKALLEYETLSGEEMRAVIRGEPVMRPSEPESHPPEGGSRSAVPPTRGKPSAGGFDPKPQPSA